ncbi:hypothetical protein PCA31118_01028 [Pandoraea captiosa]|uniref:Uncharacterized protein n=1 Tax=Pandoraea captiosa TaxID=2508302 RepID=A0A5E4ZP66_9BURK|nr:hypothetical protein PCA31118_01028 [Pandoraea captiosa]
MKTSRNRKTHRSLLPYGNLGNDWRDGWTNVNGSGGVSLRLVEGVRTYLDILSTTLISKRVPMPVDPMVLGGVGLGYRLHMRYQPTENETPPEPNATLYSHPSGQRVVLPLPVPGEGARNTGEWLTIEADVPEVACDNAFELHLASGQQGQDPPTELHGQDDDVDDGREPNWPVRPGQVHISGALIQIPGDPGIAVNLHLPALALHESPVPVSLDGVVPRWTIDGKLPICIGAAHVLALPIDEACGWAGSADGTYAGSQAYAYWDDENGADAQGLTIEPTAPIEPDDDAQLARSPWTLRCDIKADPDVANTIVVESIYHAPPYPLDCVTGHFKRAFESVDPPAYWPCIPLGETAVVRARVLNAAAAIAATGVPVQWRLNGVDSGTTRTDDEGWAEFEFLPKADATVTAAIDAPYNEAPLNASVEVRTISSLPWTQFVLTLDGREINPVEGRVVFGAQSSPHTLALKPTSDNVSLNRQCAVDFRITDDLPANGALSFEPPPGVSREIDANGLEWTVTVDPDADAPGYFIELDFTCEPWKSPISTHGTVADRPFDLVALPTPKTSMRGEVFVFGPSYGSESGIRVEARAIPDGEPVANAPCYIASLIPDTAIVEGALSMPIDVVKRTDADGAAVFPVTYRQDHGLHSPAQFTIVGGAQAKRHSVDFRRTPSDPDESTAIAVIYPGRPEFGSVSNTPRLTCAYMPLSENTSWTALARTRLRGAFTTMRWRSGSCRQTVKPLAHTSRVRPRRPSPPFQYAWTRTWIPATIRKSSSRISAQSARSRRRFTSTSMSTPGKIIRGDFICRSHRSFMRPSGRLPSANPSTFNGRHTPVISPASTIA